MTASYLFSDDEINGNEFPRRWEQQSSLELNFHTILNFKYFYNWNLDPTTNYHTGWGRTKIVHENGKIYIAQRNQSTFKNFVQQNVKLSKAIDTKNGQLTDSFKPTI